MFIGLALSPLYSLAGSLLSGVALPVYDGGGNFDQINSFAYGPTSDVNDALYPCTFYCEVYQRSIPLASSNGGVFGLGNSSNSNILATLLLSANGTLSFYRRNGGSTITTTSNRTFTRNVWQRIAVSLTSGTSMQFAIEGTAGIPLTGLTDVVFAAGNLNQCNMGVYRYPGASPTWLFGGNVRNAKIYNTALSEADLETLTGGGTIAATPVVDIPVTERTGLTLSDTVGTTDLTVLNADASNFWRGLNIEILLAGDSITNANVSSSSITEFKEGTGIITQALLRSNQRFILDVDTDMGVGGETAQTRTGTLSEYTTTVNAHPDIHVAVEAYGRNDIAAGRTAAQVTADRETIIDHLLSLGLHVFVAEIMPSDYGANTVAYNGIAQTVNANLAADYAANNDVTIVELFDLMGTTAGMTAAYAYDSPAIHPNLNGAWVAAQPFVTAFDSVFVEALAFGTSENDTLLNPTLTGTAGTVGANTTGTVPTSWESVAVGGTTDVTRTVTALENGAQLVITTGTGAGINDRLQLRQDVTGLTVGKTYRCKMAVTVNAMDRAYFLSAFARQEDSGGANIMTVADNDERTETDFLNTGMVGETIILQPPDFVIQATFDHLEFVLVLGVNGDGAAAELDVTCDRVVLERVT